MTCTVDLPSVVRPRRPRRPRRPLCSLRAAALLVLAPLSVAGCGLVDATAEEKGAQVAAMAEGGAVEIETWNGSIEVRGCPGSNVQIAFVKRRAGGSKEDAQADLKNVEVAVEESPRGVKIVGRRRDGKTNGSSGVSFVLCVPRTAAVVATTKNGDISVADVGAAVTAETSNGAVTVRDAAGALKLRSSNGRVEATAQNAVLALSTANGGVSFSGSLGAGDHVLRSNNGSIEVALPASTIVVLTATTENGSVKCDLPLDGPGERSAKHLEGATGPNATSILTISTSNGSVQVRELK